MPVSCWNNSRSGAYSGARAVSRGYGWSSSLSHGFSDGEVKVTVRSEGGVGQPGAGHSYSSPLNDWRQCKIWIYCFPLTWREIKRLFSAWKWKESEVAQSCPTLFDPMDCSLPGSSIHGIFQARVLEWVVISFSRGSSRPRDWTQVSRRQGSRSSQTFTDQMLTNMRRGVPRRPEPPLDSWRQNCISLHCLEH